MEISHVSYNKHFTGYSEKFEQFVFVKVFTVKNIEKFSTELAILKSNQNRYIYDFGSIGYNFLILKDYTLEEFEARTLNNYKVLSELSTLIADYHQSNKEKDIPKKDNISFRICSDLKKLKSRKNYNELCDIYKKLLSMRDVIEVEYNCREKVAIHGDFGVRNIKIHNNQKILIDFERSKKDIYFLDFIKFFYIDLNGDNKLIDYFLERYYNHSNTTKISKLLMHVLIFYVGLGIMKYTLDFEDKEFEDIGLKMIGDSKKYLNTLYYNNSLNK
ncbi:hypothetical protein K9135_002932 [Listeria monocytogenes]|nr:hypothetical protein [Listeria monocytogenes]